MFNEAIYLDIKKTKDPILQLYRLLDFSDDELRYYRILDEWDRDRKNILTNMLGESE